MTSQDDLALLKGMYQRGEISDAQYDVLRRHVLWGTPLPQLMDDLPAARPPDPRAVPPDRYAAPDAAGPPDRYLPTPPSPAPDRYAPTPAPPSPAPDRYGPPDRYGQPAPRSAGEAYAPPAPRSDPEPPDYAARPADPGSRHATPDRHAGDQLPPTAASPTNSYGPPPDPPRYAPGSPGASDRYRGPVDGAAPGDRHGTSSPVDGEAGPRSRRARREAAEADDNYSPSAYLPPAGERPEEPAPRSRRARREAEERRAAEDVSPASYLPPAGGFSPPTGASRREIPDPAYRPPAEDTADPSRPTPYRSPYGPPGPIDDARRPYGRGPSGPIDDSPGLYSSPHGSRGPTDDAGAPYGSPGPIDDARAPYASPYGSPGRADDARAPYGRGPSGPTEDGPTAYGSPRGPSGPAEGGPAPYGPSGPVEGGPAPYGPSGPADDTRAPYGRATSYRPGPGDGRAAPEGDGFGSAADGASQYGRPDPDDELRSRRARREAAEPPAETRGLRAPDPWDDEPRRQADPDPWDDEPKTRRARRKARDEKPKRTRDEKPTRTRDEKPTRSRDQEPTRERAEEPKSRRATDADPPRKHRRRSVFAVLTSLVLALALVGAGVWYFLLRDAGVPPADYARSVCGSVRDWQQSVDSSNSALVTSIAREEDRTKVRTAVATYYTTIAGRTDQLRTTVLDAGVVDVAGGQEYTDSFAAAIGTEAGALRDFSARAARLDPKAAATFQIQLQALLTGADGATGAISSALARPSAGTPLALRTALSAEPSCAPYVG
ncbi:MAG TPA: hypothetical protein VGP36_23570 [Mycobacteriales bacterium]|nr:hypothetical protein [Mycobacteriales bacterium]